MTDILFATPYVSMKKRLSSAASAGFNVVPFGLCTLSASCKEKGYESNIVDGSLFKEGNQYVLNKIKYYDPKVVGLTATTCTVSDAAALAGIIKNRYPKKKVLIGGPHVTSLPEETLNKYPIFDYCVLGEGERTIVNILDSIKANQDINQLKGIAYLNNNTFVSNGKGDYPIDLNAEPLPDFDWLSKYYKYYSTPAYSIDKNPSFGIITSRGCNGSCVFCDKSVSGSNVRSYNTERVLVIIDKLMKLGIKEIKFYDDNFLYPTGKIEEFCKELISLKKPFIWSCSARVDDVNRDLLKLMKDAGCWQIGYGIESASNDILKSMGKQISKQQVEQAIEQTNKAGIYTYGYFIAGSVNETKQTLNETKKFILKLDLDFLQITYYTPYPGSPINKVVGNYGTYNKDWDLQTCWYPVFVPFGLELKDLIRFRRTMYRRFYFRFSVMIYFIKRLKNFENIKQLFKGFWGFIKI